MSKNVRELRDNRYTLLEIAKNMVETADRAHRDLNTSESMQYNSLIAQVEALDDEIDKLEAGYPRRGNTLGKEDRSYAGVMADSEARALIAYVRGDRSAMQDLAPGDDFDVSIKLPEFNDFRSVDSTMNITTPADGKNTVPVGFAGRVAARRNEIRLSERLGVQKIPGKGTTVNFPYENADPNAFATTSEQSDAHDQNYERDTPVFGEKAFTLVKKTKKLELTEEILDDNDVNVMSYIADHIGRAIALTHNQMLLAEVAANGSLLKTFASAGALAAGEPEDVAYSDTLSYYLDEAGTVGWVTRPNTYGMIKSITGDSRQYAEQTLGSGPRSLLEYPVYYSNSAGAVGASAKSLYFGNWHYVGMREDPALRIIRDPYSVDGLVILKYSFRAVYGVLVAGAIGYGQHPTG
jgi:HK97 family phage major capsid protein